MTAGPEEIALALAMLKRGGLVAFPTETVYGLGADAFDQHAVEKVFRLKGRPSHNPLIVHVSGPEMAKRVTSDWPTDAQRLADALWPGPLSIVLPKSPKLPAIVTAGGPTVAVRCPDHPTTLALLEVTNTPLVGPSANLSGGVSPTRAEHVYDVFPNDEVFVLDGGSCRGGIESTVVLLPAPESHGLATILRPGLITPEQIEKILRTSVLVATHETLSSDRSQPLLSPGMLDRHYAPHTPALRFVETDWKHVAARLDHSQRAVVLAFEPRTLNSARHSLVILPNDAGACAAAFYALLRDADATKPDLIAIESPGPARLASDPRWFAVADRIRRAATTIGP